MTQKKLPVSAEGFLYSILKQKPTDGRSSKKFNLQFLREKALDKVTAFAYADCRRFMEDHVFSDNKEVKKVKSYFKKNKGVMYILLSFLFLLVVALTFSLVSSAKTSKMTSQTVELPTAEQYQQTVPTCNLDVQLVLDSSRSMTQLETDGRQKQVWAKEAMAAFINGMAARQATNPNNRIRIGLSQFGQTGASSSVLNQTLSGNYNQVISVLNPLRWIGPNTGTCISCGLVKANNDIIANSLTAGTKKAVILLSDGCGNRSNSGRVSIAQARAISTAEANRGRSSGITYYTVGYSNPANPEFPNPECGIPQYNEQTLLEIAGDSSRHHYKPNVAEWVATFDQLALDLCGPEIQVPDCTNLTADKNLGSLVVGEPVNFSVTAGGTAPITSVEATVYGTSCTNYLSSYDPVSVSGPGTYLAETWTPTTPGPFTVYGRVWNDAISECRADCVDGPPRYLCPGAASCKLSGVVNTPTPTPTKTPTPTPTPVRSCSVFRVKTIKDFPSPATGNACNYIPQIQCSGTTQYDWLAQLDYGYEIVYSNASGVVQNNLTQRGTVRSVGVNYCASPTPAPGSLPGFSSPIYLTNMPAGGSATITLSYVLPTGARALSTNLSGNRIAVYNVRAGQQVLVDGYTCLPVNGCSACTTTPNQAPVISTSTYTGTCP